MHQLRYYQVEAIDAVYGWFDTRAGNPLVVLPTGTGKSLLIADFCKGALNGYPGTKILVLTHVRELIKQNYQELLDLWPEAPAGVNSAGIGRRDTKQPIIFAGIQSVHRDPYPFQDTDIVMVDEAHLIPRSTNTMYRRFLDELRRMNPYLKIVGLTATPYRLDSGRLDVGEDALFDGIAYDYNVLQAVNDGFLSPLVSKQPNTRLNVTGVHTRGGEFIAGELQAAVDIEATNIALVNEVVAFGADRRSWLIFGSGVEHCEHLAELVREHGISCATVFGETPKTERDQVIEAFKRGAIRCLISMGVLTTGFNAPAVDLLAVARPTKSTGLYVQICGRGMRLFEGKKNCLVLDFAGNVARHGPVDAVNPRDPTSGEGEAPVKTCPDCDTILPAATRVCPECNHEFPEPEIELHATATVLPVMSQDDLHWATVTSVRYDRHEKEGKPPSMMVTYQCGLRRHREWVCFEHGGFARQKAIIWWLTNRSEESKTKLTVPPVTVDEALGRLNELAKPTEIAFKTAGKYTEVVRTQFAVRDLQAGIEGPGVLP